MLFQFKQLEHLWQRAYNSSSPTTAQLIMSCIKKKKTKRPWYVLQMQTHLSSELFLRLLGFSKIHHAYNLPSELLKSQTMKTPHQAISIYPSSRPHVLVNDVYNIPVQLLSTNPGIRFPQTPVCDWWHWVFSKNFPYWTRLFVSSEHSWATC